MTVIQYKRASNLAELEQIIALQKSNFSISISPEEKLKEGFVTVQHTIELLEKMNHASAHIIAIIDNKVVGYALVMLPSFQNEIEVLVPLFERIKVLIPNEENYVVMGQICVAKEFRNQGLFRGLYDFYKTEFQNKFDYLVTEVDAMNTRSMQAHEAIGFKTKESYLENGKLWSIIFWDWK
ncbi:GNAT family N-acetyltransferase [Flavobacterium sp.]|uniref:GNAT family N-acetyltransferase n=1 Tax=Flavobacterium sp. TaxID=239 RepID=UPI00286C4332|nr:GNAT family N-acetyltransferase [Flavobacterium sp.]